MDQSQQVLEDNSTENDMALDAPFQYQRVDRQWVILRQTDVWRPPTDVFEVDDRVVVMVEIAGMRDGEFNVQLQDRRLIISGVRNRMVQERMAFHQMEVRYGRFHTEVSLPWPIDRERVAATYKDGFLRVELPRAVKQQVHIVNVDIEQEQNE